MGVATDRDVGRAPGSQPAGIPYVRRRERNTRWVAFGLLLTTLGGLGAFVVATRLADRVDVVVAARAIDAGRPLTADDLTAVAIAGGDGARAIDAGRIPELVGSVSTADLPAGAIVHPDQLVPAGEAAERTVIVGAALAPGQYPLTDLVPGQVVQVIEVSGDTGFSDDEDRSAVLGRASVVSVRALNADELLVSLRVDEGLAPLLSERSQQRRIRLALVEEPDGSRRPPATTTTTTVATTAPPEGPAPGPAQGAGAAPGPPATGGP